MHTKSKAAHKPRANYDEDYEYFGNYRPVRTRTKGRKKEWDDDDWDDD